jgi:hypothetical protein
LLVGRIGAEILVEGTIDVVPATGGGAVVSPLQLLEIALDVGVAPGALVGRGTLALGLSASLRALAGGRSRGASLVASFLGHASPG